MTWYHPAGTLATDTADLHVTPENAGWAYSGLQVFTLSESSPVTVTLAGEEGVIVPLSARNVAVTIDGAPFTLEGRDGVFDSVSDWIYAPVGSLVTLSGGSGEIAICTARASEVFPVAHVAAADVSVEVRGSGQATRQVTNIATPGSFTAAHKINVCEVITPGGNWSSWPPHRHDGIGDCPTNNEEIYYFRIGRNDKPHGDPTGTGLRKPSLIFRSSAFATFPMVSHLVRNSLNPRCAEETSLSVSKWAKSESSAILAAEFAVHSAVPAP
jgi:5-deoxy-glucuronate isomerase